MQDDAANIRATEIGVLERQNVIIERAESGLRPVLNAIIKGVDDAGLEVGLPRVS